MLEKKAVQKLILALLVLLLIGTNLILVWPLFRGEYDQNMGSIGVAHILNARYLSRFWNQGWNPFWYGGFPNHLIYPLLAPIGLAIIQKLSFNFLSMAQVYRIVVAIAYVLTPVTLFFLVRFFTKRDLIAFLASIIYLLAPSANYFLISRFYGIGQELHFSPWQLPVIVDFGEGPHMIALSLVPLAVIFFWRFLRRPTFFRFLGSAFLISTIIAINLFSAYALAYFLLGVFISEILLGKAKQKFFLSLLLVTVVYGLIAFCYDASMITSLSRSGYIHPENKFRLPPITTLFLLLIFVLGPLSFVFYEVFKKKARFQNKIALGIWFLIFWLIPYAFYKGYWFGSQPNRYMPELNMTVAMIAAILLVKIHDFLTKRLGKLETAVSGLILILFLGGIIFISRGFIKNGWEIVSPNPDVTTTSEYKIAKWLEKNINYEKGERAFLTGSPAFFLNEFADVPQLRGDEDNAQASHWWADVVYQVNTGNNGPLAVGWLEAFNVRYIVVDFGANTPFKDFKNTEKFLSLTKTKTEIDGFKILEIPGSKEIIQTVDLGRVATLKPFSDPVKPVLDEKGLKAYLEAIKKPGEAKVSYSWSYRTKPDLVTVQVENASQNTGILFKATFDHGWKAHLRPAGTSAGKQKEVEISKIGPDLMVVKPKAIGNYTLKLSYHRPLVEYLGYVTTLITLAILGFLVIKKKNFSMVSKQ